MIKNKRVCRINRLLNISNVIFFTLLNKKRIYLYSIRIQCWGNTQVHKVLFGLLWVKNTHAVNAAINVTFVCFLCYNTSFCLLVFWTVSRSLGDWASGKAIVRVAVPFPLSRFSAVL